MTSSVVMNSAFLTCVARTDVELAGAIENAFSMLSEKKIDQWAEIGFKYIAPLTALPRNEAFLREHPWLDKIVRAIEDSFNNVKERVDAGVHLWSEQNLCKTELQLAELASAIADYLENHISAYDRDLLQSLELPDTDGIYFPINRKGFWGFSVVNPWPGDMSAEAEVLARMKAGADDAGIRMTMQSNFGHVLDPKTQKQTAEYVDADDLDFVISTHYDTHKSVDAFYYHTLWNPPEIPLNLDDYAGHVTDNYLMNDDFLIYDDGGMSKHLECILMNNRRDLKGASSLTASFPRNSMLEPKLETPKMFYCGMNWERVVHNSNRHEGLFKLLDETGKVKFFGPEIVEAWGGIRPWEGYKCYQYSIPFDGFSILKEINDCGICLVLSSDIHRRAGSATNRTYEACAAGAVIISDDNPFMLKYFGDAALFIQYNKNDPKDTFRQLMEKYQWIVEHKEDALKLAKRAQQIFAERFVVDRQLRNIVKRHHGRLECVKKVLFAKTEDKTVLATFVLNAQDSEGIEKLLMPVLRNIERQYYRNIRLAIAADPSVADIVGLLCRKQFYSAQVFSLPLFDSKKSRSMTDAEALNILYQAIPHHYFINIRSEEYWFRDHITTLVRAIEDSGACFAYSGRLFEDSIGYRRTDMFGNQKLSTIYLMNCPDWMPVPGQILFTHACHEFIPECMLPFLDGFEHYALMNAAILREKQKGYFSRRMSFNYIDGKWDERSTVIETAMQIRLIRDYVKLDLPETGIAGQTAESSDRMQNTQEVMRVLSYAPLKLWLSVRISRFFMRILPTRSGLRRKLNDRLEQRQNAFINYNV